MPSGKKIRLESFPRSTLTSAPSRRLPTRVTATCGAMEDGESKLCALLFQIPEEEEGETEDREENKDGDREKKNCTTLRRPLRRSEFPFRQSSRIFMCCISIEIQFYLLTQLAHTSLSLRCASRKGNEPSAARVSDRRAFYQQNENHLIEPTMP